MSLNTPTRSVKLSPPPPKHVRPPQPPQPKVVRRAQRPLVIEPDHDEFVVQQPTLTLGEQVKKKGVLVATQLRNCSWKPANFNCRIGAFTDVVNAMGINDNKKTIVGGKWVWRVAEAAFNKN